MVYTIELLRMVEALHQCGIIHGDIKPDNFLIRNAATYVGRLGMRVLVHAGGLRCCVPSFMHEGAEVNLPKKAATERLTCCRLPHSLAVCQRETGSRTAPTAGMRTGCSSSTLGAVWTTGSSRLGNPFAARNFYRTHGMSAEVLMWFSLNRGQHLNMSPPSLVLEQSVSARHHVHGLKQHGWVRVR